MPASGRVEESRPHAVHCVAMTRKSPDLAPSPARAVIGSILPSEP